MTYGKKTLYILLPAAVLELVGTGIASIGTQRLREVGTLSLDNIFFNKIALLDINVFDLKKAGPSSNLDEQNVIYKIRKNIATWYYAFRNFAIAFGLLALVYIGVKMAMSELAESKAKYKKMLMDWFVSIILIFVLHYFIIIVVNLNNGIIDILDDSRQKILEEISNARRQQMMESFNSVGNFLDGLLDAPTYILDILPEKTIQAKLLQESMSLSFTRGFGSSILYLGLILITFSFMLQYIKRMAVISFLTIIAPLITIMYSIDKSRKW